MIPGYSHLLTLVPRSQIFYPQEGGDTFLETSVRTRSTRRHIPEESILHSHQRKILKSYKLTPKCIKQTYHLSVLETLIQRFLSSVKFSYNCVKNYCHPTYIPKQTTTHEDTAIQDKYALSCTVSLLSEKSKSTEGLPKIIWPVEREETHTIRINSQCARSDSCRCRQGKQSIGKL
jgi:hypothetical protein